MTMHRPEAGPMGRDLVIIGCPECGAPAEVEWSAVLDSTSGPAPHIKIRCVQRHWFLLPEDQT